MKGKNIEVKRFWFRVRVLATLLLIVIFTVRGYDWIKHKEKIPEALMPTKVEPLVEDATAVEAEDDAEDKLEAVLIAYYNDQMAERYLSYQNQFPDKPIEEVVMHVNMNLDFPFYAPEVLAPALNQQGLGVLCNKYYALPESYAIESLVSVPQHLHAKDGKAYLLDERALKAYESMYDAAKLDGITLVILSAHRTHAFQKNLYNRYVEKNGQMAADTFSARPGHSEHETGLAVDLNDISEKFDQTKAFKWLDENAHRYGFILRYPKGKTHLTGYVYEPWHYRFVGEVLAEALKTSDMTLDEYYAVNAFEE